MSLPLLLGIVFLVIAAVLGRAEIKARTGGRRSRDLEAKLRPVDENPIAAEARGKAERESWSGESAEFEAHVRGLELPDGSEVEFVVADVVLGTVALRSGGGRLEFHSRLGQSIPPVEAGHVLEVRYAGAVLLSGEFARD
jgi:hypothetical protein